MTRRMPLGRINIVPGTLFGRGWLERTNLVTYLPRWLPLWSYASTSGFPSTMSPNQSQADASSMHWEPQALWAKQTSFLFFSLHLPQVFPYRNKKLIQ